MSLILGFSGIKTAVFYKVNDIRKKKSLSLKLKKQFCAGFQEAVCDVWSKKVSEPPKKERLRSIVVGGGVAPIRGCGSCYGRRLEKPRLR